LVKVLDKTREFKAGTDKNGDPIYKELFPVTVFSKLIKAEDSEPADSAASAGGEAGGAP
jgi:hypothetical protein